MAVGLDSAEIAELPAPTQYLLSSYPGVKAMIDDGRVTAFSGVPLTRGRTPAYAEAAFWAEHADAFGISGLALRETRSHRVGQGKFTVYAYHQTMEGLLVEDSIARLVIRNAPGDAADAGAPGHARNAGQRPGSIEAASRDPFVVLASGKFLAPPPGGLAQVTITPAEAAAIAQSIPPFDQGSETWPAELVVTTAEEQDPPRLPTDVPAGASVQPAAGAPAAAGGQEPASPDARPAWRIPIVALCGRRPVPYTVFIDAANGQVLRVRLEELYNDVIGTVTGFGTPGVDPDMPMNPPTELFPFEDLRVEIAQTNAFGFSTDTGVFTIPHGGSNAITVEASLADSRWFMIQNREDENAVTLSVSLEDLLPPGPAHLVFNESTPTEATTGQVNAYVQLTRTRRFWADRLDLSSAPLDFVLRVDVNGNEVPCNAAFTYSTSTASHYLTFGAADLGDEGCFNAAYSTIISHEYGHFVQRQLGISLSDSIQEGLADSTSLLIHDTDIVAKNSNIITVNPPDYAHGRDYRPGQPARSKKYPCYGSNYHECGKVLAGLWCDIRANLITEFGDPTAAKTYLNQLFVDWAQITNGGANSNAAHPLTITEILIAADDDGDLSNGVPHYLSLCSAGGAHKLSILTLGPGGQQACQPAAPASAYHTAFWTPVNVRTSEPSGENPAGVNPHGVAVADIDGDGLKDIAIACEGNSVYTGSVLVYWNNTAPGVVDSLSFDAPTVLYLDLVNSPPLLTRPAKIAIADMGSGPTNTTPDGRLDLIVTLRGPDAEKVRIYYRDSGARTFSTHADLTPLDGSTPVQSPIGLAVGDWDGDGRQDIAVTGYVSFQGSNRPVLAWLWGENSGYSTASIRMARNIGTGDEEKGSGYDLVVWQDSPPTGLHRFAVTNYDLTQASGTPPQTPQAYIFRQTSGRAYDYQTLLPNSLPGSGACPSRGISMCDLNADGRIDVIFTNADNGRLRWSPQLQNGSFDSVPTDPGPGTLLISVVPSIEGIATGFLSKSTAYPLLTDAFPDVVLGGGVDSNSAINPNIIALTHTGSSLTPFTNIEFFADLLDVSGAPYAKDPIIVDINDDGFGDVVTTNFGTGGDDIWEGFSVLLSRNY
ncbi:MAG: VCBS repeat-containing protein [Phycisphaerales bacterium]|nr:VCBS repeat-containing protein [Phycisphaerales bacterium]